MESIFLVLSDANQLNKGSQKHTAREKDGEHFLSTFGCQPTRIRVLKSTPQERKMESIFLVLSDANQLEKGFSKAHRKRERWRAFS